MVCFDCVHCKVCSLHKRYNEPCDYYEEKKKGKWIEVDVIIDTRENPCEGCKHDTKGVYDEPCKRCKRIHPSGDKDCFEEYPY